MLIFNKPINTNSFDSSKFFITGPLGPIPWSGFLEVSNRAYQISFPLQTSNGSYHFTLLPTLLDTEGFQLDQNANGIPGEPDDAYTFTLILDTIPPRVTQHAPAGDVAGTVSSVDVWFSEPMDKAALIQANAWLTNTLGQTVSVTAIEEVGLNRFRFTFAGQTTPGLYGLGLNGSIADLAGNSLSITNSQSITFNLVPVDLALANVAISTNALLAGGSVTVAWTGRNVSGAPLLGSWTDAVYLSSDNRWDISDIPLISVLHTNGLALNEIYTNTVTAYLPGALPGNYYFVIRADIFNQERETGETNNLVAFGPLPLTVPMLSSGTPFNGTLTPANPAHYFAITLAPGDSLRLYLTGQGGGVNQLFVSPGSIPTALASDFLAVNSGPSQQLILTGPAGGGTYYILVYGNQINGANPYQLLAETGPLFVTAVTPTRHGNIMPGTVTLSGAGFDTTTTVEFLAANGAVQLPSQIELLSGDTLRLHLSLTNWLAGFYTVRVTKGAATIDLAQKFQVVQGGISHLTIRLIVPSAVGFNIPIRQTLWIEYENDGETAMPAPLLKLAGDHGASLTLDTALAIPFGGFGGAPPGVTDTVQVMATGSGSTPGILQPGDSGRIPVYYIGLSQAAHYPQVTFSLSSLKADALTWIECPPPISYIGTVSSAGSSGGHSSYSPPPCITHNWHIGWFGPGTTHSGTLQNDLRPSSVPADAWAAIWANLAGNIGPEWGDYVTAVANDVNSLLELL